MTFGFQSAVNIATNAIDCIHTTAAFPRPRIHRRGYGTQGRKPYPACRNRRRSRYYPDPEIPYDIKKVVAAIQKRSKAGKRFTILAVAEGAISKEDALLSKKDYKKKLEGPCKEVSFRIL